MKRIASVLILWLCWGFALGTLTLLGPVRWLVDFQREELVEESSENTTVIVLIAVLAVVSFLIAFFSERAISKSTTTKAKKVTLWMVPLIAAVGSVYVFFHPNWVNAEGTNKNSQNLNKQETATATFAIGTYPELDKMYQLKSQGYTAVISLLHPAVVPFEPALIEKERKNAREAELQFIHIPFLPWISENEKSIDSLRKLIRGATGKYFVHCYLGKDRTNAASRIIQQENKAMVDMGVKKKESGLLDKAFERGAVIQLDKDVYLAPQPTKEEYFDVVVNFQQVVAFINLSTPEAKERTVEEEKWLHPYNIPFKVYDVNANTSKDKMQQIVEEVKTLPHPLFIHGYFTDDKEMVLFKELYDASQK